VFPCSSPASASVPSEPVLLSCRSRVTLVMDLIKKHLSGQQHVGRGFDELMSSECHYAYDFLRQESLRPSMFAKSMI